MRGSSIATEIRGRRRVPTWLLLVGLGIAGAAIPIVAHYAIFPDLSWNRDEAVYTWQVALLRDGHLTGIDLGFPDFFRPWLSAAHDGKLFSQYPLGWPLLLLASDVAFGTLAGALAIGGALSVLGTYYLTRELTRDQNLSLVAALVMLVSPILAIQGGALLSYLPTLGIGLFFAVGALSGVRLGSPLRLVGAGFALGWVFMTRPFDAVLWSIVVLGYAILTHRGAWRRLALSMTWLTVGFVPLLMATLGYNALVTGNPMDFPIALKDPLDSIGFGEHRIMPAFDLQYFGPVRAVKSTVRTLFFLPIFLAGTYAGIVAAAAALWCRRRDRTSLLLSGLIVIFPLGYFFFWGIDVSAANSTLSGPIYYVPLFAPLSILIAMTIVTTWRWRRSSGIGLVAVLVVATLPFLIDRVIVNHRLSVAQAPWRDANAAVDDRALVFVPGTYLGLPNPFAMNSSQLDDRALYAVDRGSKNLELMSRMPERTPYVQRPSLAPDELTPVTNPKRLLVEVEKITVVRGRRIVLHVRITNPQNKPIVRSYLRVGRSGALGLPPANTAEKTVATDAARGDVFETDWVLAIADDGNQEADAWLADWMDEVTVGVAYGDAGSELEARPAVRETFGIRVQDGELELLEPPIRQRAFEVGGAIQWRERLEIRGLQVVPRPLADSS